MEDLIMNRDIEITGNKLFFSIMLCFIKKVKHLNCATEIRCCLVIFKIINEWFVLNMADVVCVLLDWVLDRIIWSSKDETYIWTAPNKRPDLPWAAMMLRITLFSSQMWWRGGVGIWSFKMTKPASPSTPIHVCSCFS